MSPVSTEALMLPRVTPRLGGAASAWPGMTKTMSWLAAATVACSRTVTGQTVNGSCVRNVPAVPSVNRLGVCVAGMPALTRAWKLA